MEISCFFAFLCEDYSEVLPLYYPDSFLIFADFSRYLCEMRSLYQKRIAEKEKRDYTAPAYLWCDFSSLRAFCHTWSVS